MKNLIITPMYFHKTKGQVVQITYKSKSQCITNSMKPSHKINRSMSTDQEILLIG
jgi:hypothetical protein